MTFPTSVRLIDLLRPRPRAVGLRHYLKARWRRLAGCRGPYWHTSRKRNPWRPKPNQTGGWLPGRRRIAGLRAPKRVVGPAVRFEPKTRIRNEIVRRRRKQGVFPAPFLWAKRVPKRAGSPAR